MQLKEWIDAGPERLSQLARSIGAQPQLVWQWAIGRGNPHGRQIPQRRCPAIEQATGGDVSCEEMRPDLCWVRVTDPAWPKGKPLLDLLAPAPEAGVDRRKSRVDRRSGTDRRHQGGRRAGDGGQEGG